MSEIKALKERIKQNLQWIRDLGIAWYMDDGYGNLIFDQFGYITKPANSSQLLPKCFYPVDKSNTGISVQHENNMPDVEYTDVKIDQGTGLPKLNLGHFNFTFMILAPGYGLAILAFIGEVIWHKYNNNI